MSGTALKDIPYGCVGSLPKYNSLTSMEIFLRAREKNMTRQEVEIDMLQILENEI